MSPRPRDPCRRHTSQPAFPWPAARLVSARALCATLSICPTPTHVHTLSSFASFLPIRFSFSRFPSNILPLTCAPPAADGVKAPIYQEVRLVEREVEAGVAATGAVCLLAGFLLGRCLPRWGASSCGGGGGKGSNARAQ